MSKTRIKWLVVLSLLVVIMSAVVGILYHKTFSPQELPAPKEEHASLLNSEDNVPALQSEEVSLVAVGDVSYSRAVERMVKKNGSTLYPFLRVQDYLKSADLVFGNLETPITPGETIPDFNMMFRSNPGTEQALKEVGFSIVSLANNHTPNFGAKGLSDTFKYLDDVGVKYVGAGENIQRANEAIFVEEKGIKFAFLAYNDDDVVPPSYQAGEGQAGTAFMNTQTMVEAVKQAKPKADYVIVSMHSGNEYVAEPNDSQVNFARTAVDAGADLIIGHHPHVVQTMEKYKNKFIFYSLGNFVFDQPQMEQTKQGLAVKIIFSKDQIERISFLPTYTEVIGQPRVANANEAEKILQRLKYTLETRNLYLWNKEDGGFSRSEYPVIYGNSGQEVRLLAKQKEGDLNKNSLNEIYLLHNKKLTVKEGTKIVVQNFSKLSIVDFILANVDQEEDVELITITEEGTARFVEVWQWQGDQFAKIWRSEEGNFSSLETETFGGKNYIVANTKK
ncbi:MAG TPA: CapA family protein [bacterium]|nr:CapA family protein [bacterium]